MKKIVWIASSREDLKRMGEKAQDAIGFALYQAQLGGKSDKAKPLKGFGNATVLEVVEYSIGGTYRAVYTVKFDKVIAVLHVFQKKSTSGIKTSKQDMELIHNRLKLAEQMYKSWSPERGNNENQKE